MTRRRSFVRLGLASLTAVAAAVLPVRAEVLRAQYSVSLSGLPVGIAGLVGVFDQGRYRLQLTAQLTGLAGLVTSFKGAGSAAGRFAGARVLPGAFATATSSPQGSRTVRIGMAGGVVTGVDISPPIDERPGRIPLRPGDKRGVLDPMSALVMTTPGAAAPLGPAGCNRTIPVFDGYTRFNVDLSFVRMENVAVRGYTGPVLVCAARYVPIAGHRNRRAVQFMADNRDLGVWLAPLGSTRLLFPFKITIRTQIGETTIEASDFEVAQARSITAHP